MLQYFNKAPGVYKGTLPYNCTDFREQNCKQNADEYYTAVKSEYMKETEAKVFVSDGVLKKQVYVSAWTLDIQNQKATRKVECESEKESVGIP